MATSTSSFTDITTSIGDSESYTLIYTMTVDTISDSQSWDLEVLEKCQPSIDVSSIQIESTYTYQINDDELIIVDVADFSNGDCKTAFELSDAEGQTDLSTFITTEETGRTYSLITGELAKYRITDIGQQQIKIYTTDVSLADSYEI